MEELTGVTCCPDNFFWPVSWQERRKCRKCHTLVKTWMIAHSEIIWFMGYAAKTISVFHLTLQNFAIRSSPSALQWLWYFLFERTNITARAPFLEWKTFRSDISKENNFCIIRNSVVYGKKTLSCPPAQLPLWRTCCGLSKSAIIIKTSFIISCQYQILHSWFWEFLPFPCRLQSWELQSTLVLTEVYLRLQIWVMTLSIFLCKACEHCGRAW